MYWLLSGVAGHVPPRGVTGALNLVGFAVVLVGLSPVEGRVHVRPRLSAVDFDEQTAALVLHRGANGRIRALVTAAARSPSI